MELFSESIEALGCNVNCAECPAPDTHGDVRKQAAACAVGALQTLDLIPPRNVQIAIDQLE